MKTTILFLLILLGFEGIAQNEKIMETQVEKNKAVVKRFNKEVLQEGNVKSFAELLADDVVNHSAPPGSPTGPASMSYFIFDMLRKGFSEIEVEIFDQVAEGDRVTTRKAIRGVHSGNFMGIPATGKKVTIHVIDIIRLRDGKYVEHWGSSNMSDVLKKLSEN